MSSSEEVSEEGPKAEIEYTKSDLHRVVHVNGVYGGTTPRGDLAFDFTSEYMKRPAKELYEVQENGNLGNKISDEGAQNKIVRKRHFTAIMNPEIARSIAELMLAKVFGVDQREIHELLEETYE